MSSSNYSSTKATVYYFAVIPWPSHENHSLSLSDRISPVILPASSYFLAKKYFFTCPSWPHRCLSWVLCWDLPTSLWVQWRDLQQRMLSSDGDLQFIYFQGDDNDYLELNSKWNFSGCVCLYHTYHRSLPGWMRRYFNADVSNVDLPLQQYKNDLSS